MGLFSRKPKIEQLRNNGDIRGLNEALAHEDTMIRFESSLALADLAEKGIGSSSSIPPLNRALNDTDPYVRSNAALTLVRLVQIGVGDSSSIPYLHKVLQNNYAHSPANMYARGFAIDTLRFLAQKGIVDRSSLSVLDTVYKEDPEYEIARAARNAFKEIQKIMGSSSQEKGECPSCGHENPPDSMYCSSCGNKL